MQTANGSGSGNSNTIFQDEDSTMLKKRGLLREILLSSPEIFEEFFVE